MTLSKILLRLFIIFCLLVSSISLFVIATPKQVATSLVMIPTPTTEPKLIPLSAEKLTALVNKWRVSQGFQPYIKDDRLCKIAIDRADDGVDNHQGFISKYSSYPYAIQENLVVAGTEDASLNAWLNSSPHLATLRKPYKYSCIACHEIQCNQIFSNL